MNIGSIIVMNYLKSLKEDAQLDAIFPMLLHVLGYEILSTPLEFKGLSQYGKDIVAIKKDSDGIKKKFYFELKAGDIDNSNWFKEKNGVRDTLKMTADHEFKTSYPNFEHLPKKVVLVFNGMVNKSVKDIYDCFIEKEFIKRDTEFEEWNIYKLTELFNENLFDTFLLADDVSTKLFNRVLVNLNSFDGVSRDFEELTHKILNRQEWVGYSKSLPREWDRCFQSIRLIALIIYNESLEYNNLDIAKRYITTLIVIYWSWILKHKLEEDQVVLNYFKEIYLFYYNILSDYLERTQDITKLRGGLSSELIGSYEQVGYTARTMNYIQNLCFVLNFEKYANGKDAINWKINTLYDVIKNNDVSGRPIIDIHSIPIIDVLNLLIEFEQIEKAKEYLRTVIGHLKYGKNVYDKLPNANNNLKSVIKLEVTGEKSIYYSDSTSPLLAVLFEYLVIFDMKEEYNHIRDFVKSKDIDLGIFIPHHGLNSKSKHLIRNKEMDLEEILFSGYFNEGYQSQITLTKGSGQLLSFEEYKEELMSNIQEFEYDYRSEKVGFGFLNDLAHQFYKTPYFPDKWRFHLEKK